MVTKMLYADSYAHDIELLNLKPKDETRVRSANIRGNEYKIMIIKIN